MKAQEIHEKAFELYYDCRNYSKVATTLHICRQSVHNWQSKFGWNDRILKREHDIASGLDDEFVKTIVDKKSKMLLDLDKLDKMVDSEVITAFIEENGEYIPKFPIENTKDLGYMIGLKLKINENRLKVMGEELPKINVVGNIILEWEKDEDDNDSV